MFDGTMIEVVIVVLLLFFVASLIASAVVEAIGGFMHRRSKHLWDTLDLLLGNTSKPDGDITSIVDELYRQPFITGLVRPTDRARFDPATGEVRRKVPLRASPPKQLRQRAVVATRAVGDDELLRRYYGPIHLDAPEFTNALLAVLRPSGHLDRALATLSDLTAQLDRETGADIAYAQIADALADLRSAADAAKARDIAAAIDELQEAGDRVEVDRVREVVDQARSGMIGLVTGDPTRDQLVAALGVVPHDLRVKLLGVLNEAGEDIVRIRTGIENWYDRTMDQASSWYRKQTRYFLFLTGLVMAVSMNVDAISLTGEVYRDDATREALVGLAGEVSAAECDELADVGTDAETDAGDGGQATEDAGDAADAADATTATTDDGVPSLNCLRVTLDEPVALPIGWGDVDHSVGSWVLRVLGWLLVAAAVTLGAPFWFDLLGRALRLRGARGAQSPEGESNP